MSMQWLSNVMQLWWSKPLFSRRNVWFVMALFILGVAISIAVEVHSTDVRLDITTGYVRMEFTSGVLLSPTAREATLFDVVLADVSTGKGSSDPHFVAGAAGQTVAITTIELSGSTQRMVVEALNPNEPYLQLHPQFAPLSVAMTKGGTVYGAAANAPPSGEQYDHPIYIEFLPANDTVAFSLKDPLSHGPTFRSRELTSLSFVSESPTVEGAFSEVITGNVLFPSVGERLLNITRGETVRLNFTQPAELSLSFEERGINIVAAGEIDSFTLGNIAPTRSAMPKLFERLRSIPVVQAIAVLLSAILTAMILDLVPPRKS